MTKLIDLTGMKFGRLIALRTGIKRGGRTHWVCLCECGNETEVNSSSLKSGRTQSCGCLQRELTGKRKTIHGYTSGRKKTRVYQVWVEMRARCNNPNHKNYKRYGGRGIAVCEHWNKFENFLQDMGERPEGFTIEREDNEGNYEPRNCRWATRKEQRANTKVRKLTKLKVQVIKKLLEESSLTQKGIADIFGVSKAQISHIKSNKTWKNVLYEPV